MTRMEAQNAWVRIVDIGFSNYDQLTNDQKIWFNIEPLTTGGIIDHYVNYGAEHNNDTINALEFLGYHDIAGLMHTINDLFIGGQPPVDIDKRNEQWDGWNNRYEILLDNINDEFWRRNKDLQNSLLQHINDTKIGVP